MTQRHILAIALALITTVLTCVAYYALANSDIHVKLNQNTLNQQLSAHFPKKKTYLKLVHVTYQNPKANFLPEQKRIQLTLDTSVEIGVKSLHTKTYSGTTTLNTAVTYNPNSHQFFLSQPEISAISIPKLSEEELAILQDGLNLAAELWFQEIPIYQLKPTRNPEKFASLILKKIEITPNHLSATIGLPD